MNPPAAPVAFSWIATSTWAYPVLEVVHIVGIALLLGNLVARLQTLASLGLWIGAIIAGRWIAYA
ncbi:MAG: hypothetical protein ACKO6D_07310 [Rubrivivax sp.]